MLDIATTKQAIKSRLARRQSQRGKPADYEVLIIGAGIAGIGMACRLQQLAHKNLFGHKGAKKQRRNRSVNNKRGSQRFVILEKRADLGGTWDLFTYPGIRSDSDALTFGYNFRPWLDYRMLAAGGDIKRYIADTAREFGITEHIRYEHEVQQISWSSMDQLWTATIKNHASGEVFAKTAKFIVGATGYYDYEQGYRPHFAGEEDFRGRIVHPQHWGNLDYNDKKVVIIGSGATAMTLLPALVDESSEQCARHVTMLQRTPTYVASVPGDDHAIDWLSGKFSPLSKEQAYTVLRARNVLRQQGLYKLATHAPKLMKAVLKGGVTKELKGSGVDVEHFMPDYNPWDQRVCAVPDSDLFKSLHGERAAVVTDQIDHFTETGIMLQSGEHLEANIIVTATGLKLQMLGGAAVYIDGQAIDIGTRMTYKAVMIEGVPNMAALFGYTNASWTLKIDLACQYVVRLLSYMHKNRYQVALPQAQAANATAYAQADTVMGSLSSGYVRRAQDRLPKQGDRYPWYVTNNYLSDRVMLKYRKIKDDWLRFSR
ncbi:Predicted flavoprotein CzcO associated with the cation diffusion facilitator CzcD [Psychrobacter pacificensis]|jgi:cation diffusion facilitator CzcD-associated flavoprotein CzcO|uniref:Flavin-binding monooxygenase n=1 Tax=Psychrobacter pacificensis TaxID=112002 RepID=A0A1G7A7P7_9GAMM|nr:NAD(P)/FAD-dependent oxidoreductase [Psychrobacter pacificensis]GLR28708.1 flavin-binding monooxygenase [Psychrobacter pacificensis]SDE10810.1 Predicted flavoprotein CzcO associated with the cation diffusion facilitator CzcD [Psychrobacter pacificensis]